MYTMKYFRRTNMLSRVQNNVENAEIVNGGIGQTRLIHLVKMNNSLAGQQRFGVSILLCLFAYV